MIRIGKYKKSLLNMKIQRKSLKKIYKNKYTKFKV